MDGASAGVLYAVPREARAVGAEWDRLAEATVRMMGLPLSGFDRLSSGTGQMSWRLLGLVRVMTVDGPDITRSAAGRLAAEIALVPTAFRAVTWTAGEHRDSAIATCQADGETERRYPFGMTTEAEATFAGVTLPVVFRAGWWWGTDRQESGEFFRGRI